MHIGHKKVHLILIAHSPSDTLIFSHFQISICHLTLVIAFFSKIWSNRDCDFAWTCIKKEKVMSNIKASFLSGQLETHVHTVLFPVKGKVAQLRKGLGGLLTLEQCSWDSNWPEITQNAESNHVASWNLSWGFWIWGKAEGYLMQALLEELWWTRSMTVPLPSSSPRCWAQPFTSA